MSTQRQGHRGTEAYTPEFGELVDGLKVRALAFYDFGWVKRIHPGPSEIYSTASPALVRVQNFPWQGMRRHA